MIGAIIAAYLPQIRHLRKSTTGETPLIDGLSPYYIFSHGLFCNAQLSFALLSLWGLGPEAKLSGLGLGLCFSQLVAQWGCVMTMYVTSSRRICTYLIFNSILVYTIGRSKEVGGKIVVPALVLAHAFFFVFIPWTIVIDDHSSHSSLSQLIGVVTIYLVVLSTPLIMLVQICAQWWELRKMSDFGALNLRSCCMQAAVMAAMALRLFFTTGFTFDDGYDMKNEAFSSQVIIVLVRSYFGGFMSYNFIMWIGGAGVVYLATRGSKTGMVTEKVELGAVRL